MSLFSFSLLLGEGRDGFSGRAHILEGCYSEPCVWDYPHCSCTVIIWPWWLPVDNQEYKEGERREAFFACTHYRLIHMLLLLAALSTPPPQNDM